MKKYLKWFKTIFIFFKPNYDGYVPYFWAKKSFLCKIGLEDIRFVRSLRLKYWHKIAAKYPPFKPFFDFNALTKILNSRWIKKEVKDIYRSGTCSLSNVLNQKERKLLNSFINKIELDINDTIGMNFIQLKLPPSMKSIEQKLIKKLSPFYETFFPLPHRLNNHSKIYIGLRIDFSEDGVDASPPTANWHADRFIPTINAIYFPYANSWGVFEKDIGCPLITERDFDYYLNTKRLSGKIDQSSRENLYVDVGRKKKRFTNKANTMIVGTHHLQHRRSPYNKPGKRIGIFIDHYDFFDQSYLTKKI
jgi:hypothetical protein